MSNKQAILKAIECSKQAIKQEQLTLENLKSDLGKLVCEENKIEFGRTVVRGKSNTLYLVTGAKALSESKVTLLGRRFYNDGFINSVVPTSIGYLSNFIIEKHL